MLQRVCLRGLWISTIAVLALVAVQGLSGHWIVFFTLWPGDPDASLAFRQALAKLYNYHRLEGYAIGTISILILFFAFVSKSNMYVRIFAVVGIAMTALAVLGGVFFVASQLRDSWSLGQMADAFVGVFGAYFLQLCFMIKTPRFPWSGRKVNRVSP